MAKKSDQQEGGTAERQDAQERQTAGKAGQPNAAARRSRRPFDALLAPVKGATKRDIGHVQLEVGRAGAARVKRMIYPPGFHWSWT